MGSWRKHEHVTDTRLMTLHAQGLSTSTISKLVGLSVSAVRKRLAKLGLKANNVRNDL